jgi:hypothetical protein
MLSTTKPELMISLKSESEYDTRETWEEQRLMAEHRQREAQESVMVIGLDNFIKNYEIL